MGKLGERLKQNEAKIKFADGDNKQPPLRQKLVEFLQVCCNLSVGCTKVRVHGWMDVRRWVCTGKPKSKQHTRVPCKGKGGKRGGSGLERALDLYAYTICVIMPSFGYPRVAQVFCSAMPVAYAKVLYV